MKYQMRNLQGWKLAAVVAVALSMGACAKNNVGADGAMASAATPGSQQDFVVNVGDRVFFESDQTELSPQAIATLDKQAQWLNQYPNWKVKLQGSADDPGSPQAQTALSQKRADAVKNYLASLGIGPERMLAKGYGREKIGDDCPEIECKAQNRRVVTNLQENPEF